MKNQYFGDKRDFFKYNLLLDLLECLDLATLTFIPMLTPDYGTNEGHFKSYKCKDRRRLKFRISFLILQNKGARLAVPLP
jgi:hypothetical protein